MEETQVKRVLSRFISETGEVTGSLLDLPIDITVDKLQLICNAVLQQEEETPYVFFVKDQEILTSVEEALGKDVGETEQVLDIVYQQQAVFRVRTVTRCTSSMPGHAEAVISVSFSPDGSQLASGSGDTTVRLWDIHTQTPLATCTGHKHWVLCVAWAPDGTRLASACKNGLILIWDSDTGKQVNAGLTVNPTREYIFRYSASVTFVIFMMDGQKACEVRYPHAAEGHKQWVTALSWEPLHLSEGGASRRLISAGKDSLVKIWDSLLGHCILTISGHTKAVTAVRWGGSGLIYTASQDRTVKVWRAKDGILCRTLEGHAHWVNTLALSTDHVIRTGAFEPVPPPTAASESRQATAARRYTAACDAGQERLVSGSDDFTLFLWLPEKEKKPVARMTGHQQLINDVKFSPDGRILASASFDKSIKVWDGRTGKFLATLRGHVQAVYQVAWSADSRLLVSGSADSTLKVWNVKTGKLDQDLPGHADQVFAVDWSPDGSRVASGGKDKVLRLWQN